MRLRQHRFRLASALGAALALIACNPAARQAEEAAANDAYADALAPEALPMSAEPAGGSLAIAPALSALPAAAPLDYAYADEPDYDDYAWIDRADMLLDTIGDAPPDYAFGYDGVEPWAWQTEDDYLTFAEPIDGGYRYYYYEPGAAAPFLVRSPGYSYGYREGRVTAVYGPDGRILSRRAALRQAQAASRYYARARTLHIARDRDLNRRPVAAPRWASQRPAVAEARRDWAGARQRQADWRTYRERREAIALREQFRDERQARAAAAQRFDRWQRAEFRGSPPRLYDRTAPRHAVQAQRQRARAQDRQAAARQQQAQARQQAAQVAARQRAAQAEARRERGQTSQAQARQQAEVRRRQSAQAPAQQRAIQAQRQREQAQARQGQARQQAEVRRRQSAQVPARQRAAQAQQAQARQAQSRQQAEARRRQAAQAPARRQVTLPAARPRAAPAQARREAAQPRQAAAARQQQQARQQARTRQQAAQAPARQRAAQAQRRRAREQVQEVLPAVVRPRDKAPRTSTQ